MNGALLLALVIAAAVLYPKLVKASASGDNVTVTPTIPGGSVVSALPQPGQYGIPPLIASQPVGPVVPVSPAPPAQAVTLQQAYSMLAGNVQPPAIDNPPFGIMHGLNAGTWNNYLAYYAGYAPPLSVFPDQTSLLTLDEFWAVALPALRGQGLQGLGWIV